jgi:hypothetical protein
MSEEFTIERVYHPAIDQSNALGAAKDKGVTREAMAAFYADLILCADELGYSSIDWKTVNAAIVARWPKGLEFIKEAAWKILRSRGVAG